MRDDTNFKASDVSCPSVWSLFCDCGKEKLHPEYKVQKRDVRLIRLLNKVNVNNMYMS